MKSIKSVRIVVEFSGPYAYANAMDKVDDIRQAIMHRDPTEEPDLRIEVVGVNNTILEV